MSGIDLLDAFTDLPPTEQRAALIYLSLFFPVAFADAIDAAN